MSTELLDATKKARKVNPLPSLEFLRECFEFRAETGELIWRERPRSHFTEDRTCNRFRTLKTGKRAGRHSVGKDGMNLHVRIDLRGWGFLSASRIVMALHEIPVPDGMVPDHFDGDSHNNRLDNLRVITDQLNHCNLGERRNKRSGLPLGITKNRNRFRATMQFKGAFHDFGSFASVEEAVEARKSGEQRIVGELSRAHRGTGA